MILFPQRPGRSQGSTLSFPLCRPQAQPGNRSDRLAICAPNFAGKFMPVGAPSRTIYKVVTAKAVTDGAQAWRKGGIRLREPAIPGAKKASLSTDSNTAQIVLKSNLIFERGPLRPADSAAHYAFQLRRVASSGTVSFLYTKVSLTLLKPPPSIELCGGMSRQGHPCKLIPGWKLAGQRT